mgnify:CR=1 FL=1
MCALCGVLGGGGHFIFIKAYELAPASILSPFMYSAIIWGVLLGYFMFGELPDAMSVGGMLVIVASGIAVARLGLREQASAPPTGRG